MPLPKALLCVLGNYSAQLEENKLRKAGFATAVLSWNELSRQTNDWMQLCEVLDDPAVQAWVIAGEPAEFTKDIICMISLLTLALQRKNKPCTAFINASGELMPVLPPVLQHIKVYSSSEPFAARLMAARFKPAYSIRTPFFLRAILDPYIGIWLEVGPSDGVIQSGFTIGVLNSDILAFGVGEKGHIPARSTMSYPVLGMKGTLDGNTFSACAAKNEINQQTTCYCRIEGIPYGVFLGAYLNEDTQTEDVNIIKLM